MIVCDKCGGNIKVKQKKRGLGEGAVFQFFSCQFCGTRYEIGVENKEIRKGIEKIKGLHRKLRKKRKKDCRDLIREITEQAERNRMLEAAVREKYKQEIEKIKKG